MTRIQSGGKASVMNTRNRALRPRAVLTVVLCILAVSVPAAEARTVAEHAAPALGTIHIDAYRHHYDLSRQSLRPGPLAVTFTDHGPNARALQTARLDPGRTQAEFVTVL